MIVKTDCKTDGSSAALIWALSNFRRMKLKKEIQAIKELNEQEKAAQAAKASQMGGGGCDGPPDSV